ncbi:MAG: 6-phosphogluconolactonase [Actinobacteria bacterium]|jgi:6-phosphogluconolactonase|nr:6-phosphogluconolactonase [Actinomycetota bacterium]MCL6094257.1 6-phosphogluconolactonase [Actinomycetota bacterium]
MKLNGTVKVVNDVPAAFAEVVNQAFITRLNKRFSFMLSGGDTARACYERLAETHRSSIDWGLVDFYWGDERCVPFGHPDSNYGMAKHALLDRLGQFGSAHPMQCKPNNAQASADSYAEIISQLAQVDLIHLGMGPDGHTASLFEGTPLVDPDSVESQALVACTEDPSGKNPHLRLTVTLSTIAKARLVVFTVAGESKRAGFADLLAGKPLPAAVVKAPEIIWLVDKQAAPSLSEKR